MSQKRTKTENGKHSGKYALSGILFCGNCGAHYKRVTWARGGTKKIVWRCVSRLEFGTKYCKDSFTLSEDALHAAIQGAMQTLLENKDELIASAKEFISMALGGDGEFDAAKGETMARIKELQSTMMKFVRECGSKANGAESYNEQFKEIADEISRLQSKLDASAEQRQGGEAANARLNYIISVIEPEDFTVTEYDDSLVRAMVESVTVLAEDRLLVSFKEFGDVEVGNVSSSTATAV